MTSIVTVTLATACGDDPGLDTKDTLTVSFQPAVASRPRAGAAPDREPLDRGGRFQHRPGARARGPVDHTDLGELSSADCRAATTRVSAVIDSLRGGVAQATACFAAHGGTATFTARSGSVSETAKLDIHPIPRQLSVVSNPAHAVVGDHLTFTAYVADCAGQGESNVPLTFRVT